MRTPHNSLRNRRLSLRAFATLAVALLSLNVDSRAELVLKVGDVLSGIVTGPVRVPTGVTAQIGSASVAGTVVIEAGASLEVQDNQTAVFNGGLTNRGTLRMLSRDRTPVVTGSGFIENFGTIAIAPIGGGGGEARIGLPVNVRSNATLLVAMNSFINFAAGSQLNVDGGIVELQEGARLRFEGQVGTTELKISHGGRLLGSGLLEMDGSNRLLLGSPLTTAATISLRESSSIAGDSELTLLTSQTLTGTYGVPVRISGGSSIFVSDVTFNGPVIVDDKAALEVADNQRLTLGTNFVNRGVFRMKSRDRSPVVNGSGTIENFGTIEIYPVGRGGGEARFTVPVRITAGSSFRLAEGGFAVFASLSELIVDGAISELKSNSRLRLEGGGPARRILVRNGAQLIGPGTVELDGSNTLEVQNALATTALLDLRESSRVTGNSLLTFLQSQTISGAFELPIAVATGTALRVSNVAFKTNVSVLAGASIEVVDNQFLELWSTLTNHGLLKLPSRDRTPTIRGKGSLENNGTIEVYPIGGGGGEASFAVPLRIAPLGKLVLDPGAYAVIVAGSAIVIDGGAVELGADSRLRLDGQSPARDIIARNGARLLGVGRLELDGANKLLLESAVSSEWIFDLRESSRIAGAPELLLRSGQTLTGTYDTPVRIDSAAVVRVVDATFNQSLVIVSGSTVEIVDNQSLIANAKLANDGTIRMSSRDRTPQIRGAGSLENRGVLSIDAVGGGGGEAAIRIPVSVSSAGKVNLEPGAFCNVAVRGALTVEGGTVQLNADARLRFEGGDPARDFVLRSNAKLLGSGSLMLDGRNRLLLNNDLTTDVALALHEQSRTAGTGILTLTSPQELTGVHEAGLVLKASSTVNDAVFRNSLVVQSNVTLSVVENQAINVDGVLDNFGVLTLRSRDRTPNLRGAGAIRNYGTIQITAIGGSGGEAAIRLPVFMASSSLLALEANAFASVDGGSLQGAGTILIPAAARLRFITSSRMDSAVTLGGTLRTESAATVQVGHLASSLGAVIENDGALCVQSGGTGVTVSGKGISTGCRPIQAPIMSTVAEQRTAPGKPISGVSATVSDPDTAASALAIVARSSNDSLLRGQDTSLTRSGNDLSLDLRPITNVTGSALILITAADPEGNLGLTSFRVVAGEFRANQPPSLSVPAPQPLLARKRNAVPALRISDVDAGNGIMSAQLSVTKGSLSFGTVEGLSFLAGSNGASGIKVSGTLNDLNRAFATLLLTPNDSAMGAETLTVTVDDGGNSGSGGAQQDTKTVPFTILDSFETDSDGDGMSDALEIRAGTNPFDKADVFGITPALTPPKNGSFALSLRTVPGRTYKLQNLTFGASGQKQWADLASEKASGPVTVLVDDTASQMSSRIYRTVMAEDSNGGNETPSPISSIKAVNSGSGIHFNLTAANNTPLVSVDIEQDGIRIGAATNVGGGNWNFPSLKLTTNRVYTFRAVAKDSAGNITRSEPLRLFAANPLVFSAASSNGTPAVSETIAVNDSGALPPVVFTPLGPGGEKPGEGLQISVAAGARVSQNNQTSYLQFYDATARFSPGFPIQFVEPLRASGDTLRQLLLGDVTPQSLANAFGLNPSGGLRVLLFGKIPAIWNAGVLELTRIRNAKFSLDLDALPLPKDVVDADGSVEFDPRTGVHLSVAGIAKLPGGASLAVPVKRPVSVTVRPDGSLTLEGRGELAFENGPRFTVDLTVRDPVYALEISGEKMHLPMLESFMELLPIPREVPSADSALRTYTEQLRNLNLSYSSLARSFVPCDATADQGSPTPTSAADAIVYGVLADSRAQSALQLLTGIYSQFARSANAADDCDVCEYYLSVLRAKAAAVSSIPEHEGALNDARAAVIARSRSAEAVRNLAAMQRVAACLLEVMQIGQATGISRDDADLTSALSDLILRFSAEIADQLQVQPGLSAAGSKITTMDQFEALQSMRDLVTVERLAQLLNIDLGAPGVLLDDAVNQAAARVWTIVNSNLSDAEQAKDSTAFLIHLSDAMEMVAAVEAGQVQSQSLAGPSIDSFLRGLASRIQLLIDADQVASFRAENLSLLAKQLEALNKVLRRPGTVIDEWRATAQRVHDRANVFLTQALTHTNDLSVCAAEDAAVAFALDDELRTHFGFALEGGWTSAQFGGIIDRITELARASKSSKGLEKLEQVLLDAAQRSTNNAPVQARVYLNQAKTVLVVFREILVNAWNAAATCAAPSIASADMLLPGDIVVQRASGSLRYDRSTASFAGTFSGDLKLPKFDLALTIANASINTSGEFDLNAFGRVALPTAQDQKLRLALPAEHPLHVQFRGTNHLSLEGGVKMDINGASFEAYGYLDDPEYTFGFMAKGLRFDLADSLRVQVPALPSDQNFSPATLRLLNSYYRHLNSTFESLRQFNSGLGALAVPSAPATGGAYAPAYKPDDTDALKAWVGSVRVANELRLVENGAVLSSATKYLAQVPKQLAMMAADPKKTDLKAADNLVETLVLICSAPDSPEMNQLRTNAAFAATVTATKEFLLALLNARLSWGDHFNEPIRLTARFSDAVKCGAVTNPLEFVPALRQFVLNQETNVFTAYGLDPRGNALPTLADLKREKIREGLTNLMRLVDYSQRLDDENTTESHHNGLYTLALRFRELTYAEILKIAPADSGVFFNKLYELRHGAKTNSDAADCDARVLRPELLKLYDQLRQLKNDLTTVLNMELKGAIIYSDKIYQPYGPPADYDYPTELQNLTRAWMQAFAFAVLPIDRAPRCLDHSMWKIESFIGDDGKPHLRQCRPDLIVLLRDDYDPRKGGADAIAKAMSEQLQGFSIKFTDESMECRTPIFPEDIVTPPTASTQVDREVGTLLWAQKYLPSAVSAVLQRIGGLVDKALAGRVAGLLHATAAAPQNTPGASSWQQNAEIIDILLDALDRPELSQANEVTAALLAQANRLLRANADAAGILKARLPAERPVDLKLPGDLAIDSVSGEVHFDRSIPEFGANFAGRLSFPNLNNAYFEIVAGSFDSDFNFSIDAQAGAVSIAGNELRNARLTLTSHPPRDIAVTGSGSMHFANGIDAEMVLGYNSLAHQLTFNSKATQLQNLRFTDHMVLFDAGVGFVLDTQQPVGQLTTSGTLALFNKRPLGTNVTTNDFYLVIKDAQVLYSFNQPARTGEVRIVGGTLLLPENFSAGLCDPTLAPADSRPFVRIDPQTPISVALTLADTPLGQPPVVDSIAFSGGIDFGNLGLRIAPQVGLAAEICLGNFIFPGVRIDNRTLDVTSLPRIHVAEGKLSFIPPSTRTTNYVILQNADFDFTGLPTGTLFLQDELSLLDASGFEFALMGGNSCGADKPATALIVSRDGATPVFEFRGGVRMRVAREIAQYDLEHPAQVQNQPPVSSADIELKGCGGLILREDDLPRLSIDTLGVRGNFKLGPLALRGASLTLSNIGNIFNTNQAPDHPFTVLVGGTLLIENGPGFGLQNCQFVFDNLKPEIPFLPHFEPGTLIYDGSQWALTRALPIQVQTAQFDFRTGRLPFPTILSPTNVVITTTATIALPPGDNPVLGGGVKDMVVTFAPDGTPLLSIDALKLDIAPGRLKIPPIKDLGGTMYIGGISDPVGHPERILFAGKLTGTYSEMKLSFLAAMKPSGPIGLCLDVKGGSVGIPLPYGFLINGASGGISFANNNGDPCEIRSYIDSVTGKPKGDAPPVQTFSWEMVKQKTAEIEARAQQLSNSLSSLQRQSLRAESVTPDFECPGDCPPYSVNIFCQPHPDQGKYPGKVITKFTSIEPQTLKRFGITEQNIEALLAGGVRSAGQISQIIASGIRSNVTRNIKLPPAGSQADALFKALLDNIEAGFRNVLEIGLSQTPLVASNIYQRIADKAYEGIPCQDMTFKVSGTLSHTAVGMFLSVTGEGLLSTAGAAGVSGYVNFVGLPVGTGKVFVTGTDDQGNPNPGLCAEIKVSLGPLDIGILKAAVECDGCINGVAEIFATLVASIGSDATKGILDEIADAHYRDIPPPSLPEPVKVAFIARVLQDPGDALPGNIRQRLIDAIAQSLHILDPKLLMCGQVQPKLFGIPLAPDFVSAEYEINKTGRAGRVGFSPSMILAFLLDPRVFPPVDSATLGYREVFPDFDGLILAGLRGAFLDPAQIQALARSQVESLLQNTTMTATYKLAPMGFELARAQARVIVPDFVNHPLIRPGGWTRPESRGLPSRTNILQAMLRSDVLGNPLWPGTSAQLAELYPGDTNTAIRSALLQNTLQHDYFPHGGIIGAAYLDVPRAIYEPVPNELETVLNPNTNALARALAGLSYVSNYILKTTNAGQLNFYVPAPNPPVLNGNAVEMLNSLTTNEFDLAKLRLPQFYPISESFVGGYLHGQVLGIQIADAVLEGIPPGNGADAYFHARAQVSNDPRNWLKLFVDDAFVDFEIRQSPTQSIARTFTALATDLEDVRSRSNQITTAEVLAKLNPFLDALASQLPKSKVQAVLNNVHMPAQFRPFISTSGNASFSLLAYSPRFEPTASGSNPLTVIRRNGGIGMKGVVNFAGMVSVDAEFGVLPRPYDPLGVLAPPDLIARVTNVNLNIPGGMQLQNASLDLDTRVPRLAVNGGFTGVNLGAAFQIRPLTAGNVNVNFAITGPGQFPQLNLSPARLESALLLGAGRALLIHGANTNQPFTFSSQGPWTANVSALDSLPFELRNGSEVYLRLAQSNVTGMKISRDATGVFTFAASIASGSQATIFPGASSQQTITFGGAGTVQVSSDGTFRVDGALQGNLIVSGLPITSVAAGSTITLERALVGKSYTNRLIVTGSATLASLSDLGGGTAQVRLEVPLGASPLLSGSVTVPALEFGAFRLEPEGAANFTGILTALGVELSQGTARLLLNGSRLCSFPLNATAGQFALAPQSLRAQFTVPNSGDFNFSVKPSSFDLMGYTFNSPQFQLGRIGGVFALRNFQGTVSLPVIGSAAFSGTITSGGGANFTNVLTGGQMLSGFPVARMTNILSSSPGAYAARVRADLPKAYWRLGDSYARDPFSSVLSPRYVLRDEMAAYPMTTDRDLVQGQGAAIANDRDTAVRFNGTSSMSINVSGDREPNKESDFDFAGAFSIEFWIKAPAFSAARTWDAIVTKGDSSWRVHRSGNTRQISFGTSGLNNVDLASIRSVDDDKWHHIVAAYDGATKFIYIDGKLDNSASVTGTLAVNNQPVLIGANAEQAGRNLTGLLDEVAIYQRALNADQVREHYRLGSGSLFQSSLVLAVPNVSSLRFDGKVDRTGEMDFNASANSLALAGFGFDTLNSHFSIASNSGVFAPALAVSGRLALPGLVSHPTLAGFIDPANHVTMSVSSADLTLGTFNLTKCNLTLDSNVGLDFSGETTIGNFGKLFFKNKLEKNGTYDLVASGVLVAGGYPVLINSSNPLHLTTSGISGPAALTYGKFNPPVTIFGTNGKLSLTGSLGDDTHWQQFATAKARLEWHATFSASSDVVGLSAKVSGTFGTWVLLSTPPESDPSTSWFDKVKNGGTVVFLPSVDLPTDGTLTVQGFKFTLVP